MNVGGEGNGRPDRRWIHGGGHRVGRGVGRVNHLGERGQGGAPRVIGVAAYVSSDPTINGSSATTAPTFAVGQDGTTASAVTLVAPNNRYPSVYSEPLTFQTTVKPSTAGPLLPTGVVTFLA